MSAQPDLEKKIEDASRRIRDLLDAVASVIVGQRNLLEGMVMGLLCEGHVLLEGVPGLAKSLMVQTLARSLNATFHRIQFTPDLLPADLLGTQIFLPREGTFTVKKGPVFAQVILADEVNRAPPKVQSALLEAMQERQVTLGDQTLPLPEPFIVLATQNPIEHEGTYPLPEAQVDRFFFKLEVPYPSREEEIEIVNRMAETGLAFPLEPVLDAGDVLDMRKLVNGVYMDAKVRKYGVDLVFATREPAAAGCGDLEGLIQYGASPRASIALCLAARAFALMNGRSYVIPADVKSIAPDVLRHRVLVSYEAEAEEVSSSEIIRRILDRIEVP